MDFDIVQTPTLQAVASLDEKLLGDDLQRRVEGALKQSEEPPQVSSATRALAEAQQRLSRLRTAERALSKVAKLLRDQAAATLLVALDEIVESAVERGEPDFRQLSAMDDLENRSRYANRAIQRVVEQLIPLAEIACLREESHAEMTKARAIEAVAQERAERVLGQLRDAVADEMVLPVDMSKGVSGALLAQAGDLKRRAIRASENADRLERAYCDRSKP